MDPKAPSLESKIQILVSCRPCPMPDVLVLPLRLWSWKSFFFLKTSRYSRYTHGINLELIASTSLGVRTDHPPATIACQAFTVDG